MPYLSAKMSASMAKNVYRLVTLPKLNDAISELDALYGSMMEVAHSGLVTGRVGGPVFIKSRAAFGLCCLGKGPYKGHAFIMLRGTKFLGDWLTNFNVGTTRSAYGQSIHDGFHKAFLSMESQVSPFLTTIKSSGVHSVHCIGHSLGGGLASVCAEYFKAGTSLKPYLYTFGAPRVGLKPFADMLSKNLTPERMFRVYHRTDIVPCIPFWPFVHAPTLLGDTYDYFQPSPGAFPSGEWHSMDRYVTTVGRHDWPALRGRRTNRIDSDSVEKWLNLKSPVSFTVTNLEWVDKAISYVLSKCLKGIGAALTLGISSSLTLMDQLAYFIKKGVNLADNVSSLVLRLLRKIMEILGMKPVLDKVNATHAFIRNIFQQLSNRVSAYCQRVLDNVLVNGQGV